MAAPDIEVCIVDDHHIFRKALGSLVKGFPRVKSVVEAENGLKCIELVEKKAPNVILLDLEMPLMNGMDCAEKLLAKYPDIKIIILTMHDSEKYILHMIEMGVHSFLLKHSNPDELERAIYAVYDKDYYHNDLISGVLRKSMQQKLKSSRPGFSNLSTLTEREQEVLKLICEEKSVKEIAHQLGMGEKTVHTHKLNIQNKLNVKSTVGLVRMAYEFGMIQ